MSGARWLVAVLFVAVGVGLIATWTGRAAGQGSPAGQGSAAELEGRYLAIETDRALDDHSTWLKNAHVQTIGGEPYLSGKSFTVTKDGKEDVGITVFVSMHHIEQIYVYESLDEVKKSYEDTEK